MLLMTEGRKTESDNPLVETSSVAGFIRRLTHDVRNTLNALDLQLLLLESEDPEVQRQLAEARQMIGQEARRLSRLSLQFQTSQPQWIQYTAEELMQDLLPRLQKRLARKMSRVNWPEAAPKLVVRIDFEMVSEILVELIENALNHGEEEGPVSVQFSEHEGGVSIRVTDKAPKPASAPGEWGTAPFLAGRNGGYGLGLFHARQLAQKMDLALDFQYQPVDSTVVATLSLPVSLENA
ncbi:MAG: hypothetical protein QM796_12575 [Chthoniobacteraceae bacterium]